MGFVTAGVSYTTGEITSFMPSTGGFIRHATKYVEPALGAAAGWNFCMFFVPSGHFDSSIDADLPGYAMTINAAAEISAAATVIQFWNTSVNAAVWITVFLVFIVVINFVGVRLYGEVFTHGTLI